jgi:hypothetical protein
VTVWDGFGVLCFGDEVEGFGGFCGGSFDGGGSFADPTEVSFCRLREGFFDLGSRSS